MTAAARLLDRLDRIRPTGPGRWASGCPCCESKRGRPLSIRELDDGRVLVHAFCGCSTESVLGALGLRLTDLFPERVGHQYPPCHGRVPARDLLEPAGFEVDVAAILVAEASGGHELTALARARLALAAARIGQARVFLHGR